MEAFELIKRKLEYIAKKRIEEIKSGNNNTSDSFQIKKILAQFNQFKHEWINQISFIDSYIKNEDYVSFYMTKSDFTYIKDKIHSYSEELTYLK